MSLSPNSSMNGSKVDSPMGKGVVWLMLGGILVSDILYSVICPYNASKELPVNNEGFSCLSAQVDRTEERREREGNIKMQLGP